MVYFLLRGRKLLFATGGLGRRAMKGQALGYLSAADFTQGCSERVLQLAIGT